MIDVRFKITLEDPGDPTSRSEIRLIRAEEPSAENIGVAVGLALLSLRVNRSCHLAATIAVELLEAYDNDYKYWPGYQQAVQHLYEAARHVVDGWYQHDQQKLAEP